MNPSSDLFEKYHSPKVILSTHSGEREPQRLSSWVLPITIVTIRSFSNKAENQRYGHLGLDLEDDQCGIEP